MKQTIDDIVKEARWIGKKVTSLEQWAKGKQFRVGDKIELFDNLSREEKQKIVDNYSFLISLGLQDPDVQRRLDLRELKNKDELKDVQLKGWEHHGTSFRNTDIKFHDSNIVLNLEAKARSFEMHVPIDDMFDYVVADMLKDPRFKQKYSFVKINKWHIITFKKEDLQKFQDFVADLKKFIKSGHTASYRTAGNDEFLAYAKKKGYDAKNRMIYIYYKRKFES